MVPHSEPRDFPLEVVRAKLTAAILDLELAREGIDNPLARAVLDAALREAWGAVHLLYGRQ